MIYLDYTFYDGRHDRNYEFELDSHDIEEFKDYFVETNKKEAQEVAKELYLSMPKDDKEWAKDEWNISNVDEIDYDTEKGRDFIYIVFKEFVEEDYFKDNFYDEMQKYFEPLAEEAFKDALEYERDPLGYYGMSWSDFI